MVTKDPAIEVTVFLMADAVAAAKANQRTPDGYYNLERMLKRMLAGNGNVLLCGSCMDARGLSDGEILEGARRSTMDELAAEKLQRIRHSFSDRHGCSQAVCAEH